MVLFFFFGGGVWKDFLRLHPRYVVLGSDLKLACSCFSWLQKNMGRSHSGLKGWTWKSIRSWFFHVSFWKNKMRSCHRIPWTQILEFERKNLSIYLFHLFFLLKNRTSFIAIYQFTRVKRRFHLIIGTSASFRLANIGPNSHRESAPWQQDEGAKRNTFFFIVAFFSRRIFFLTLKKKRLVPKTPQPKTPRMIKNYICMTFR